MVSRIPFDVLSIKLRQSFGSFVGGVGRTKQLFCTTKSTPPKLLSIIWANLDNSALSSTLHEYLEISEFVCPLALIDFDVGNFSLVINITWQLCCRANCLDNSFDKSESPLVIYVGKKKIK